VGTQHPIVNTASTVRIRKICDEGRCRIVKVKVRVKFTLEQAMKTKRGSTDLVLLFL